MTEMSFTWMFDKLAKTRTRSLSRNGTLLSEKCSLKRVGVGIVMLQSVGAALTGVDPRGARQPPARRCHLSTPNPRIVRILLFTTAGITFTSNLVATDATFCGYVTA